MRKRTSIAAVAALASLALLIPSGSANAAIPHRVAFCGINNGVRYVPMTLKPGQACTFWPLAVQQMSVTWSMVHRVGDGGGICIGVVQSPPGYPKGKPLSPTGSGPGNYWSCAQPFYNSGLVFWRAANAFDAVYGEPVVLNYTSSTIKVEPASDSSDPYGWLYYYG
jgi:hypothetical protein